MHEKHRIFRDIAEKFEHIIALATDHAPIARQLRKRPKPLPPARSAKGYKALHAHHDSKRKDKTHSHIPNTTIK